MDLMKKTPIGAVVFDLDGTLVDTEPVAFGAILERCQEWGVPMRKEDAAVVAGKKWEVAFDLIFSLYKFPLSKEDAAAEIIELYKRKTAENLPVIPGAVEAVKRFAARGPIAVVSGSFRDDVLFALKKLGVKDLMALVYGAEDYGASKPSPEGYLKAIKKLGVDAEKVLIFEDSGAGIKSGLDSGAIVTAITSTNHFGHDQSGAHLKIKDFREVTLDWIEGVEKRHF
jgi:HAD superfamily hydrolase (TIGR01509 family)